MAYGQSVDAITGNTPQKKKKKKPSGFQSVDAITGNTAAPGGAPLQFAPPGGPNEQAVARLSIVEQASGQSLPTPVALALSNSQLRERELERASRLLARRFDLSPEWLFQHPDEESTGVFVEPEGLTKIEAKKRPGEFIVMRNRKGKLVKVYDPLSGGEMTLQTARRLIKPYEAKVIRAILQEEAREPRASRRGQQVMDDEPVRKTSARRIARFMKTLSPLPGEMPFNSALGIAVDLARKGVAPDRFEQNLKVAARAPYLDPVQAASVAMYATNRGVSLRSVSEITDAMLAASPEAQEAVQEARRIREARETAATGGEVQAPPESAFGVSADPELVRARQALAAGEELATEKTLRGGLVPSLAESGEDILTVMESGSADLQKTIDEVSAQVAYGRTAGANGPVAKFFGQIMHGLEVAWRPFEIGLRVVSGISTVPSGLVKGAEVGAEGPWTPIEGVKEEAIDLWKDVKDIWHGRTTFGTEISESLSLPEWTAPIIDLSAAIAFDPVILAGRISKARKFSRTIRGAVERGGPEAWVDKVDDFINTPRWRLPSGEKGRFSQLIREAAEVGDETTFYRLMKQRTLVYGTTGAHHQTYAQAFRFVQRAKHAGRSPEWIEVEIDRLFAYALGGKPPPGSFAEAAAREMEALQQTQRTAILNPAVPGVVDDAMREVRDARQLIGTLEDWDLASRRGLLSFTMQELPRSPSLLARPFSGMADALRARYGDNAAGRAIRALINHPPTGQVRWDVDADTVGQWRRYAVGSRKISQAETDEVATKLGNLLGSVDPDREKKIMAVLNKWNETVTKRIFVDDYGVDPRDIDGLLRKGGLLEGEQEIFGVARGFRQGTEVFREPLFSTQQANAFQMYDPVVLRRIAGNAVGAKRWLDQALWKMSKGASPGLPPLPAAKIRKLTSTKAYRTIRDMTLGTFMRIWKPLVVIRPAYVLRVPFIDEGLLRYSAVMGVWSRMESTARGVRLTSLPRRILGRQAGEEALEQALRAAPPPSGSPAYRVLQKSRAEEVLTADERAVAYAYLRKQRQDLARQGYLLQRGTVVRAPRKSVTLNVDGVATPVELKLPWMADEELEAMVGVGGYRSLASMGGDNVVDAVERAVHGVRGGQGGVVPKELTVGMEGYERQWRHVLVNQVGQDPMGAELLFAIGRGLDEDALVRHMVAWGKRGENRWAVSRILGKGWTDEALDMKVRQQVAVTRDMTGASVGYADAPFIADTAARGTLTDDLVRGMPEGAHPSVNGFAAEVAFGAHDASGWKRFTTWAGDNILEKPTNVLNRHVMARNLKLRTEEALLRAAGESGIEVSPSFLRHTENTARQYAALQVRRALFDFRDQARYMQMTGFLMPFFQPFSEVFVSWGRILRQNPAVAGYVGVVAREFENFNIFRRNPDTGENEVPMSWFWGAGPLAGLMTGVGGWEVFAPLTGFNLFASTAFPVGGTAERPWLMIPTPGLSPPVMYVLQQMLKNDSGPVKGLDGAMKARLSAWATQFGEITGPQSFVPPYLNRLVNAAFPGWMEDETLRMQTEFLAVQELMGVPAEAPEQLPGGGLPAVGTFGKVDIGGMEVAEGEEPFRGVTSELWDGLTQKRRQELWNEWRTALAVKQAREFSLYRGLMSAFFPSPPIIRFPTVPLREEFSELQDKHGNFTDAREEFLRRHPDAFWATVAKTAWEGGTPVPIPSSPLIDQILHHPEAKRFAVQHPELVWALIPPEVREMAQDDIGSYFSQLARDLRRQLGPEEWLENEQTQMGWAAYWGLRDTWVRQEERFEAQDISESDGRYIRAKGEYDTAIDDLRRRFPLWGEQFGTSEVEQTDPELARVVTGLLESDVFMNTETGKGLGEYWDLREKTSRQMGRIGMTSLDTKWARENGYTERYDKAVEGIFERHPDFKQAYDLFFSDTLKGLATAKERAIGNMTEAEYEVFAKREKQWQSFDFNEISQLEGTDQDEAFLDRRRFINRMMDLPKKQNPVWLEWKSLRPDQREGRLLSLSTLPYMFWTRFDREVVAGVKSNARAEAAWEAYADGRLRIARMREENPSLRVGDLYSSLDAQMFNAARKNPALMAQLQQANDWGWRAEHLLPYSIDKKNLAGPFWRAWIDAVRKVQSVLIANKTSFLENDKGYRNLLDMLKMYRDEVLFAESGEFRNQWGVLEEENGLDDLIWSFVTNPDDPVFPYFFPTGGWGAVGPAVAPTKGARRGHLTAQIQSIGTSHIGNNPLEQWHSATLAKRAMRSFVKASNLLGEPIVVTDSYRSAEMQASVAARKPGLAAPQGQSLHEQGIAIDVNGDFYGGYNSERYNEVVRILESLGWRRWSPGGEPWHFSYRVVG